MAYRRVLAKTKKRGDGSLQNTPLSSSNNNNNVASALASQSSSGSKEGHHKKGHHHGNHRHGSGRHHGKDHKSKEGHRSHSHHKTKGEHASKESAKAHKEHKGEHKPGSGEKPERSVLHLRFYCKLCLSKYDRDSVLKEICFEGKHYTLNETSLKGKISCYFILTERVDHYFCVQMKYLHASYYTKDGLKVKNKKNLISM